MDWHRFAMFLSTAIAGQSEFTASGTVTPDITGNPLGVQKDSFELVTPPPRVWAGNQMSCRR